MAGKGVLKVRVLGDTSNLKSALGKAGGMVAGFGAAAAAAIGGVVIESVKRFAAFDEAMTESTAIMGDLSDAMRKDMADAAREVGKTTRFSATEAAEAFFFLASAGLDAKQSIAALPQVAAFATAGAFDLSTATDLLTDAQSALGLSSDDAAKNLENMTRVSDVLVKANTLANASVEQFSTSLTQKAGAALRNLGKDVEEGVAALAVFADQGIKGERAGTLLQNTLDGLALNAQKNADEFAKLNIKVFDSQGEMRNLGDIAGDLTGAFAGMSDEQKTAALRQLGFNKQAADGIKALLGNEDALKRYEEGLRSAAGTTEEVKNKQLESFNAKWDVLKGKIEDVALTIGESLLPHLERFVDWLDENWPTIEEKINQFIGWMSKAASWVARKWDDIKNIFGGAFDSIMGGFDIFSGLFTGDWRQMWNGVTRSARGAWNLIDGLLGMFLGDTWTDFKGWAGDVVRGFIDTWNRAKEWTRRGLATLAGKIGQGIDRIKRFFRELPGNIVGFLVSLPGRLVGIGASMIQGFVSGVTGMAGRVADAAMDVVRGAVNSVKSFLGIASPSKLFADMGEDSMRGLQMGLDSIAPKADLSALMDQAEMDAQASLSMLTDSGDDARRPFPSSGDGGRGVVEHRLVVDFDGADEDLKKLFRKAVRKEARGSAERFFKADA